VPFLRTPSGLFEEKGSLFFCLLSADLPSKKGGAPSGLSKLWCSISRIWGTIVSGREGSDPTELSLLRESGGTGVSILPFLRETDLILLNQKNQKEIKNPPSNLLTGNDD
jgi:hypothetical protein